MKRAVSTSWRKSGRRFRDLAAVADSWSHVMNRHCRYGLVVVMSACGVLPPSLAPLLRAQAGSTSKPAPPAVTADLDGGWPRDYTTPSGGALRVFQPQVASWDGQRQLVAFAAVSYIAKGAAKASLGSVKLEAGTAVAVNERLVNLTKISLTESNFPGLPNEQLREVVGTIEQSIPQGASLIALDRVLARLDKSQLVAKNVDGVKAEPPVIFYSTTAAVLVNLDNDPVWSPIKDNDLRF